MKGLLRAVLPRPYLVATLVVLWVVLQNRLDVATVVGGLVVGMVIARFAHPFWPEPPRFRRPLLALRLTGRLLGDIVVANMAVAALILRWRRPRSRFVSYPLEVRGAVPVTLLSSIISLTPGTVTVDVDRHARHLLIHCLDLDDEAALIAQIRTRYEQPLKELFP
jgi:multicomponent K+:H+ antiporter subunit E